MKHNLPMETRVGFKVGPGWGTTIPATVCKVDTYNTLLYCQQPCTIHDGPEDCYQEPYIHVRVEHWTCVPISQIAHIWEPGQQYGRSPRESDWDLDK